MVLEIIVNFAAFVAAFNPGHYSVAWVKDAYCDFWNLILNRLIYFLFNVASWFMYKTCTKLSYNLRDLKLVV